jgi:hypothetical protein
MRVVGAVGCVLAAGAALLVASPPPTPPGAALPFAQHLLGPVSARSVYWVGHSLMNSHDSQSTDRRNVIDTVGALAAARAQSYASFDHTLWGSPLSLAYRGATHGGGRTDDAHAAKRAELSTHGERYDALVMTDTVPIDAAMKYEHSAYYATRLSCEHLAKRPDARIYLYESWVNLQGASDQPSFGSPAAWRFRERLAAERSGYERLADAVSKGAIVEPGWQGRLLRWVRPPAPCLLSAPVLLIPVASVFAALDAALCEERWTHDGRALAMTDFFNNPALELPADWPRDDIDPVQARAVLETLPRRDPNNPIDDIHPNARGIYLAAIVSYAVLYRQSPVGLPALDSGLSEETLQKLQELVWRQVSNDVRTGVLATAPAGN